MSKQMQQREHQNTVAEPTLPGAYLQLLLFGTVGGHWLYLRDYQKARKYHHLATLSLLPPLVAIFVAILPYPIGLLNSFLFIASMMVSGASIIILLYTLIKDLLFLTCDFQDAKICQWNVELLDDIPPAIQPLEPQTGHQIYHTELKNKRLSLLKAYLWLVLFGAFGEHKALMCNPQEMISYCRLSGIMLWPILCSAGIVVCFQLLAWLNTWIDVPQIFMDFTEILAYVAVCLFTAGVAAVLLAKKLIADAITMPRMVATFNEQVQRELLGRYAHLTKNLTTSKPIPIETASEQTTLSEPGS